VAAAAAAQQRQTEEVRIFGPGHKNRLSRQWGIEHTYSVPLVDRIAANGDSGTPYILEHPESTQSHVFESLAKSVVSEVAKAKFSNNNNRPTIEYKEEENNLLLVNGQPLSTAKLRRACRCAMCVEELTGRQILVASDISESIRPLRMQPTGNYALSVDWSDAHRSLYPYRQILSLLDDDNDEYDNYGATTTTTTTSQRKSMTTTTTKIAEEEDSQPRTMAQAKMQAQSVVDSRN